MKNFINKIITFFKTLAEHKSEYLNLISIKQVGQAVICEFDDPINTSGHLIKINLNDVMLKKSIQKNIDPETLLLIGSINETNKKASLEYKLSVMDIVNKTVTLENIQGKITVSIHELVKDATLIQKINQLDLVKILCPLVYSEGYKASTQILSHENRRTNGLNELPTQKTPSKITVLNDHINKKPMPKQ